MGSCNGTSIGHCARGDRAEAYGFGWRHAAGICGEEEADDDESDDNRDDDDGDDDDCGAGASSSGQPVEQLDLATVRVIGRYATQAAAGRAMGATGRGTGSSISKCARGERAQAFGFDWRHVAADGEEEEEESADDAEDDDAQPRPAQPLRPQQQPASGGHPVEQLELGTGRVICRYPSQRAAARAMGAGRSSIAACLRGEQPEACGFGWRHVVADRDEEPEQEEDNGGDEDGAGDDEEGSDDGDAGSSGLQRLGTPSRPVEQLELGTGRVIARFASQHAAARAIGVTTVSSIGKCARGEYTQAHGFGWRPAVDGEEEGAAAAAAAAGDGDGLDIESNSGDTDVDSDDDDAAASQSRAARPVQPQPLQQPPASDDNLYRPVEQVELGTGRVVARYASQDAAGRAMGATNGSFVGECASGQRDEAHG
jgi:hypothetical protein